ncbi:ankyrin repeat and LEM domain-containing protein 2-like [Pollicipes pollicipes]|uniref:ankyrin repeat and LEM domain-containing protein 2-like n=1 Tax=Pollicipes pollicipes TaxID=41117 RepID=UPI00188499BF|nr:ankyrin repeat and LEM domain-containing protein 2-like [Pollicipes pollicipes]
MSEGDDARSAGNHPSTFYGVNLGLPEGAQRPEDVPLVCTSIQEVQAAVRTHKTARFKQFTCRELAAVYSGQRLEPAEPTSPAAAPAAAAGGEKPSPFRNPTRPEFQAFRSLVEHGDEAAVAAAVERNPRLLVSSGDAPALLREGPRHNALHLAALHGRPAVCRRLLQAVAEPGFFRILYPDDEPEVAAARARRVTDLYLNVPTKGTYETPLHLASKLGHVEVVRELVRHPACKRDVRNKFGETPEQVICKQSKGGESADAARQLAFLLQDPYYVQVLADADGCEPPVLAPPCSPQQGRPVGESPVQSPDST